MSSESRIPNDRLTLWDFLALPDEELEHADLVAMNITVAKGVKALKDLDVRRYVRIVDDWTREFARRLPASEEFFRRKGPEKWKNDIRFYRVGMLQVFLGSVVGIRYREEEKHAKQVQYTDPGSLFLNGVIDTKIGSCANMATLHVAMSRRMGWPVSLALVRGHEVSRFDDGEVVYNIEASHADNDAFFHGSDEDYIRSFKLPKIAVECGSDLRKLTAREMMGVFLVNRARHYQDTFNPSLQDVDCCLARHLFPSCRELYTLAMIPYLERGRAIFNSDEVGHPAQLHQDLAQIYAIPNTAGASAASETKFASGGVAVTFGGSGTFLPREPGPCIKEARYVVKPAPRPAPNGRSKTRIMTMPIMRVP